MLERLLRSVSYRAGELARRAEFRGAGAGVLQHRDCLETIRVLRRFCMPTIAYDVGANYGQWSYVLHQVCGLRHVVMFEPQAACSERLIALRLDGAKKIFYPYALGDSEGTLFLRGGGASASMLEATGAQLSYFPGSVEPGESEPVTVRRLDAVYEKDRLPVPDLIKIDVQGFELNVLRGAHTMLQNVRCLVVELSLRTFYEQQPKLSELLRFLEDNGFVMVGRGFEWVSRSYPHELLQVDGIFLNSRMMTQEGAPATG